MSGINKVILIGHVSQTPVLCKDPKNGPTVALYIRTSDTWTDSQTGSKREKVELHRVLLHKKLAEVAHRYLYIGDKVYIEGSIYTSQSKENLSNKYRTSITLRNPTSNIQLLSKSDRSALKTLRISNLIT